MQATEPRQATLRPVGLVGLGWRPKLAADLLEPHECVDFVEGVAETCFAQPAARREARAIGEVWPVVIHGVKLSLGRADGVDMERTRQLGALTRELRAPAISEHVAFTRGGAREIGHLTTLPLRIMASTRPPCRAGIAGHDRSIERKLKQIRGPLHALLRLGASPATTRSRRSSARRAGPTASTRPRCCASGRVDRLAV